ncbi:MAG: HNH endonuclease [Solirubrobacterales bacterium]
MIGFILSSVIQLLVFVVRLVLTLVIWTFRLAAFIIVATFVFIRNRWPQRSASPAGRQPIDPEVRWAVFRRDGYACLRCGTDSDLTIDHIHPVALGGTNHPSNLQTLCRSCNAGKGILIGRHDYRRPAELLRG